MDSRNGWGLLDRRQAFERIGAQSREIGITPVMACDHCPHRQVPGQSVRGHALLPPEAQTDPNLMACSDVRRRYHVEDRHVQDLINGIAQDAVQKTYATLPELLEYCYRAASCAGLLTIPIIGLARGVTMDEAAPFAIKLGQALQMTDILADVGEEGLTGRVYLPADELAKGGLTAEDILAGRADAPVRESIRRLTGFTRDLYNEAWPGFAMLSGTGRAAVGMGTLIFRSYLDELERRSFDSVSGQLSLLAGGGSGPFSGIGRKSRLPHAIWSDLPR